MESVTFKTGDMMLSKQKKSVFKSKYTAKKRNVMKTSDLDNLLKEIRTV